MMNRRNRPWMLLVVLLMSISVSWAQADVQSRLRLDDHPMVGQVWSVNGQRAVTPDAARSMLLEAQVVLLGEVHGNPDHHALQLDLLEFLRSAGRPPALVFEIFNLPDQPAIDAARARGERDADALAEAVGMEGRGWDWPAYRPLVQFALDHGLAVIAANLSRPEAMQVARQGFDALPREDLERLGLLRPLPEDGRARLERRIVDSHCGHLDASRAGGMIDAQRARDAYMADRLAAVPEDQVAVLISGTGHARLDYGVPVYLRQRVPDRRLLSLGFTEVSADRQVLQDYVEGGAPAHHLLWFTRRHSPEDPCEAFRQELEKMREG